MLAAEAARYLAAVEAFRREGQEPRWEAEGIRGPQQPRSALGWSPHLNERRKRC